MGIAYRFRFVTNRDQFTSVGMLKFRGVGKRDGLHVFEPNTQHIAIQSELSSGKLHVRSNYI